MPPQRTTRPYLTVVGLILALAMAAFEATVVATAMPTVIGELGGIHHYSWVASAYLLASAITIPIFGKLSDIYGRKPLFLLGIAGFLLGSAASGAAQSMAQLIVFRAVQGLGAGAMQPMAMTIPGDIFELEERSRIQGWFGAAWGLFGLIGPLLGGLIVRYLNWRWVFYINIPLGLVASSIVIFSLHERVERKRHTLDYLGAAVLSAGVVAVLLASSRLGPRVTLVSACAAAVLLPMFLTVERRAAEPLLPLSLFARPVLLVSSLAGAIVGGAMIATLTYVPLFVQSVMHGTPTDGGSAITPMVVGWPVASWIAGRLIPSRGFRPFVRIGMAVTGASAVALAAVAGMHNLNALRAATLGFGVGMGLSNTALLIAVQTSVEWAQRGIATASTIFFRIMGGTIAVAVMGGVINAALATDPTIPPDAASSLLTPDGLRSLSPALIERLGRVLSEGLDTVFWMIAAMAVVGFVVTLWFPHVPIHATQEQEVPVA